MKILFVVIITSIFPLFSYANCTHDSSTLRCVKYVSNYDGDTIKFNIPNTHPLIGKKISIRVNGVDTAEIKAKTKCEKTMATTTRDFVREILLRSKNIELRNIKRGKYFRIVADVYLDEKPLKDSLLKHKLAVPYYGKTKAKIDWCKQISKVKRQLASEGFPIKAEKL